MPKDLVDTIDDRQKHNLPKEAEEGIIFSLNGKTASVRVKGSTDLKKVSFNNTPDVKVGNRCLIQWVQKSKKYVMITVFSTSNVGNPTSQNNFQLFPPNNLTLSGNLPNTILVSWDVPPQQDLTFAVQTNTSAIDSGATTVGMTRGGQLMIHTTTPLYVRVRSVTSNFKYSAWSVWGLGTPGPDFSHITTAKYEPLCFDGEILFLDGDVVMIGAF